MNPRYPTNVKIPEEYVSLIDENMQKGGPLSKAGFKSRAHVVRTAVYDLLMENGIQPAVHPNDVGVRSS